MSFVSHAQNFEDVTLWRALKHVEQGFYIDVGAHDPINDSVSLGFYEQGWRGVHVEPLRHKAEALQANRPDERVINAAVGRTHGTIPFFSVQNGNGLSTASESLAHKYESEDVPVERIEVPSLPLSDILDMYAEKAIHWLKIDVEGFEEIVIGSWQPSNVRPWVVVVESTVPNTRVLTRGAWHESLVEMGYEFVYFDGLNSYYLFSEHRDLASKFGGGPTVFDGFFVGAGSPFAGGVHHQLGVAHGRIAEAAANLAAVQSEAAGQIAALSVDLRSAQTEAANHFKMLQASDDAKRDAEKRIAQMSKELTAATRILREVRTELGLVTLHRNDLLKSHSWKMTAPIRKLVTFARVARHNPKELLVLVRKNLAQLRGPIIGEAVKTDTTMTGNADEYRSLPLRDQMVVWIQNELAR